MAKKITHSPQEDEVLSSFFGVLLFLLALLALYLVCISFPSEHEASALSRMETTIETHSSSVLINNSTRFDAQSTDAVEIVPNWQSLTIEGVQEVGETLRFTIGQFSPDATYRIDFGDGKFRPVQQQTFFRTYQRPGNYVIQVQMEYRDQTKVVSSKKLNIFDAIEMQAKVAEVEF